MPMGSEERGALEVADLQLQKLLIIEANYVIACHNNILCIGRLILSLSLSSLPPFLPPPPHPSAPNRSFLSSRALTKATVASSTFDSGTLVSGWTLSLMIYSRLITASSSSSILPTQTSSGVPFLRRPTPSKI